MMWNFIDITGAMPITALLLELLFCPWSLKWISLFSCHMGNVGDIPKRCCRRNMGESKSQKCKTIGKSIGRKTIFKERPQTKYIIPLVMWLILYFHLKIFKLQQSVQQQTLGNKPSVNTRGPMKLKVFKIIWIMQIVNLENSQPDHGHGSRWYDAADTTWIQVLKTKNLPM